MNGSFDQAGELDAKPLPIPSEARQRVYLPHHVRDTEMQEAWLRWGGKSDFFWGPSGHGNCGICIFRRGCLGSNNELAARVRPFLDEAGAEANVFEYDPCAKKFVRINNDWLETYYGKPN